MPANRLGLALPLALLLVTPVAVATEHDPDQGEAPEEVVESTPGFAYGGFVLLGTLAIAGLLGWLTLRPAAWKRARGWRKDRP